MNNHQILVKNYIRKFLKSIPKKGKLKEALINLYLDFTRVFNLI